MSIVGRRIIEEVIIPLHEVNERICDICGADATTKTPCGRCWRDLCADHQIDVSRMSSGNYGKGQDEMRGVYCKPCLIAEINERYK